ncbi:sensor histidine kinase [Phytoactinopolyspora mesophila]|uniref:Sensor-like histidine kinase SenX3 n=1 Tax=Phytoactinopolyspora mesophila TaxID=2650750 RepID=A0A7K3M4F8_9ACTN|nr:ATP-binding protein [Phytoactinopolyspora mesophila]NDL58135.1 two-component sensor histidine kinase [Phytoactinopolyspora mesophila]
MNVDVIAAGVLAAVVGLAVGLVLGWRVRARSRQPVSPQPSAGSPIPEGAAEVVAVLRSSAIVLDENTAVVKASPSAYAFGLVRQDRIAVPELLRLAEKVQRDGQIRELQLEVPRSRDTTQTLHVSARVAPLGDRLLLALVEDRTHQIRIDEVRRDFVANVSHELKTPVGALMLLAEAVQDASDDPEAVQRFAARMQREGTRLSRLVEEIIDLSRLQYDDPVDSPEPVEIDNVVAAAIDRCRVDAENRHVRLTAGGTADLQVLGNEKQLVIAVGNLVENAVSYSPEGSKVAVGVGRREDLVEISVTDQGYGIAETELDRIFERFYRVDPARSRETGGTGLGLSIVKHIAASHGGDVNVWSVQGAGSTFTLRLPLHPYRPGQPPGVVSHAAREAP